MLTPQNLKEYQKECILHMLYNPDAMLWLQMGLGKTVITLTSIVDLMNAGKVRKTLIFGPLRVISSVWTTEAKKWSHTQHLTFSIVHGTKQQKLRALFREADVYLINYEQMNWLAETLKNYYLDQNKPLPFQCVVYDEISKLKHSTSLRVQGGKRDRKDRRTGEYITYKIVGWRQLINNFSYRYGLTGTPASNGYIDLHGQYLVLDGGKRLGERITHYRDSFFTKGYNGWSYDLTAAGKEWIERKIADITVKMDSKDYLDLPAVTIKNITLQLSPKVRSQYKQLEKDMFTELDNNTEIEVFNAASLSNKCLQFCNGSPYVNPDTREWHDLHRIKIDALKDIIDEASGKPVLCSYTFKADAERIMKEFKKLNPINLTDVPPKGIKKIIDKWNKGEIKLIIGHPASMGHGIDGLQYGGSIMIWFGLNWSLELYDQMNGRLNRQGQTSPVSIIHLLCEGTIDEAVLDAISTKHTTQEGLKKSLDKYRGKSVIDFY